MVCPACGTQGNPEVHFCQKCGTQMVAAATPPPAYPQAPAYAGQPMYMAHVLPRVQPHLQNLSVLWLVYAVYRFVTGILGMFFLKTFAFGRFGNPWMLSGSRHFFPPMWLGAMMPIVLTATIVGTVLALFVGFSLMTRKPWGRVLAIVVAILTLFKFPLGTALGIYTLWVLAPSQSGPEYDAIADRA